MSGGFFHEAPLPPLPLLRRQFRQLLQRFFLADVADSDQCGKLGFAGPGFVMFPVVDRQSRHADQLPIVGSRQTQPASLSLDRASRKANALRWLFFSLRLAILGSLLQELDLPFLLAQHPLERGNVTSVLGRSLLGLANLGLDFFLGEAADFFFENTGEVRHGGGSFVLLGIWVFYRIAMGRKSASIV